MNRTNFFLLGLLLLIFSCGKNESITPPDVFVQPGVLENYEPTVTPITGSVDGFVTNENGDPIEGATVKLGSMTTSTNEDGHFDFLNVNMNKSGTLIQVIHPGYFDGSRRFNVTGTGVDRVRIQLLQKVYDQSIDAATGGQVTFPGADGTIDFPANSIIDANGNLYHGTVDIAVKYLDPTARATSQQMPGDLFGITEELEEQILVSYGMIAVELVDVNGNPLNLGEGTPATVTSPIPADLLAKAPATIPLWSYDETLGVWVEEGEASLINGEYVGEVTHFSWWNFDVPGNYVELTLKAIDQFGNPISNLELNLISLVYGASTANEYTNSVGEVGGLIPANEVLELNVLNPNCSGILHSQNIGPFTNPVNALTITVTLSPSNITTISGDLTCAGSALNNAVMRLDFGIYKEYIYGINANFSVNLTTCVSGDLFTIRCINPDPLSGQESITYTGTTGITNNLGVVDACQNSLSEYLLVNIDGVSQLWVSMIDGSTQTYTKFSAYDQTEELKGTVSFKGVNPGAYPGQQNNIGVKYGTVWYWGYMTTFNVMTSATGITGFYSGEVYDPQTDKNLSISGSFGLDK